MTHGPRKFGSTEHLASEAIAAYVDNELRMNAYLRAAQHLSVCPDCAAEVDAQQQARRALRHSGEISMPSSLLGTLSRIPHGESPLCNGKAAAASEIRRWSMRWRK